MGSARRSVVSFPDELGNPDCLSAAGIRFGSADRIAFARRFVAVGLVCAGLYLECFRVDGLFQGSGSGNGARGDLCVICRACLVSARVCAGGVSTISVFQSADAIYRDVSGGDAFWRDAGLDGMACSAGGCPCSVLDGLLSFSEE